MGIGDYVSDRVFDGIRPLSPERVARIKRSYLRSLRERAMHGEKAGMAREGEPIFVLRAQDVFAPEIIEHWANRVEYSVLKTVSSEADKTRQKVKEARALAHTMRAWQVMNHTKIPD